MDNRCSRWRWTRSSETSTRVLEDDRPDRRSSSPVPDCSPRRTERAEGVEGLGPCRVGSLVEDQGRRTRQAAVIGRQGVRALRRRSGRGAEEGLAEVLVVEADPRRDASNRLRRPSICCRRSCCRCRASSSSSRRSPGARLRSRRLDLAAHGFDFCSDGCPRRESRSSRLSTT